MNYMDQAAAVVNEVKKAVKGKDECIVKTFCALLAGGHVLIQDIPGVGKTTMARAFSQAMGLESHRTQFNPDVMPSDIIGYEMYDQKTGEFRYRQGAIMCNLFLADELNRTSPRTQSALLQAMEEGAVTVESRTYELPKPFFVIATDNPYGSAGTQKLPESQLDRFMICISMGYPDISDELEIVKGKAGTVAPADVQPVTSAEGIRHMQSEVHSVFIHDRIYDYIGQLVTATRSETAIELGLSPRGTIATAKMSQAMAYLMGRDYVVPEDVQMVFTDVAVHRIKMAAVTDHDMSSARNAAQRILRSVDAPGTLDLK